MRSKAVMLAAVLVGLGTITTAHAVPFVTVSNQGMADAYAAEQAFLGSLGSYHTETFEGYLAGAGSQANSIVTSVGTFTRTSAGAGGACDSGAYDCGAGVAILDDDTTPFSGRFAAGGDPDNRNWLDSMDARTVTFTPGAGITSLGFYLTDPNDAGGRLSLGVSGTLFDNLLGAALSNGRAFYVSLFDPDGIDGFSLYVDNPNDGYAIDNVTVAQAPTQVPEPATFVLLGIGLLALWATRRRCG